MRSRRADIVIIGAGFAGLATAYYLSRLTARKIVILEREPSVGGHASGRNAGMIRQTVSDASLMRAAISSSAVLRRISKESAAIQYQNNGSMLLDAQKGTPQLNLIERLARRHAMAVRRISYAKAVKRDGSLRNAEFREALFCPGDAFVDIRGLLKWFISRLRSQSVSIRTSETIQAIERTREGFNLQTSRGFWKCRTLVNAAGAWAGPVGRMAGAARIPFKAYRRHLFWTRPVHTRIPRNRPFVWDLSHSFYYRPCREGLLVSPCDKELFELSAENRSGDHAAESVDPSKRAETLSKINAYFPDFPKLRFKRASAGLRTMVPDGRFVIGEDRRLKGFFWVAGLGGHGVTTCFSVGKLASGIILGGRVDPSLKRAFAPGRFTKQ